MSFGLKASLASVTLVLSACTAAGLESVTSRTWGSVSPACDFRNGSVLVLEAQSVPTAALIPCIERLPVGWRLSDIETQTGLTRFRLDSDRHGEKFLEVSLSPTCAPELEGEAYIVGGGIVRRSVEASVRGDLYQGVWFFRFDGGCVTYSFSAEGSEVAGLDVEVEEAMSFVTRAAVDRFVRGAVGIELDP